MQWRNKRTFAFVFWLVLVIIMVTVMPDLNKLVIEKGQVTIPETSQSEQGAAILTELNTEGEQTYQFAIVFHDEEGLSADELAEIDRKIEEFEANAKKLDVLDSLYHTQSEQAADQLVSEDGTTILAQLSIRKEVGTAEEVAQELRSYLAEMSMDTYVTGSDLVISDFAQSTQDGVKKTEIIAVAFIIIILIIIFRSPVVPLISLMSVGVSYIVSLSIVALLVEHFDLPFSNFTQVFLVVILFGVGTDYNILLFTRFKEELAKQGHVLKAITTTYQTAGKTVIYSGLAVFIGFLALFLAQFSMYKATGAVAIGVAVLLVVLLTLNPFFMGVFGFKMFWPIKEVKGHDHNKTWHFLSKFGFIRPLISILFVAVLTVPFIWNYSGQLNYNDLVEIDDKFESKQAVSIIEAHYDAGFSSPVSLAISADESLATQEMLPVLDELAGVIGQIDGVSKVYSVTRPEGSRIEELYITDQSEQLLNGLGEAQDGVSQIHEGLSSAEQEVSKPQDLSGVPQLINGTAELQSGASQLQQSLSELNEGLVSGSNGAKEIEQNLTVLNSSLITLKDGVATLSDNYTALQSGFSQFSQVFETTSKALNGAKAGYEQIQALMTSYIEENPEQATSEQVQMTLEITKQALSEMEQMQTQLTEATTQYAQLVDGMKQANGALQNATNGIADIQAGASQLAEGAEQLTTGLQKATSGSSKISNESGNFVSGLSAVNAGQKELHASLEDLKNQMATLADGLKESTDGLSEIYTGLDEANSYLKDLSATEIGNFFIPEEILKGDEFKESVSMYMNDDETMTSMMIILDVNPYTEEAMNIVKEVDEKVQSFVASSRLADDQVQLTGKTMTNVDLQSVSQADFIRSAIVMMIGIMLILLWVTRSLFQTLIILSSLFLANFAALGVTEIITSQLLGYEALSWNVPFFTMIMIITLGVDYSIFFMMRFNETKDLGLRQVIPSAAEMGGVIVSAAVILGGTFAALMPSGIITLIQVAIAVMVGLVFLSCIIIPVLLPACFGLLHKIRIWNKKEEE